MSERTSVAYLELLADGQALLEEVDDYVDLWHESESGKSLSEFLGMTDAEYALWAQEPDMLAHIVRARHFKP